MEFMLLLVLCLYLPAASGQAGRIDVYTGQPRSGDADLSVAVTDNVGTTRTDARFDPDFQPFMGMRLRGGGEAWPVGLALDFNYERTRDPRADLKLLRADPAFAPDAGRQSAPAPDRHGGHGLDQRGRRQPVQRQQRL